MMNTNTNLKIGISGHTDNVGNANANLQLSLARAKSVKQYLVSKGINETRLQTNGYGIEHPIFSNATPQGRAQNRRIEMEVLSESSHISAIFLLVERCNGPEYCRPHFRHR